MDGTEEDGSTGIILLIAICFGFFIIIGCIIAGWFIIGPGKTSKPPSSNGQGPAGSSEPWVTVPMDKQKPDVTAILKAVGTAAGVAATQMAIESALKNDGKIRGLLKKITPEIKYVRSFTTKVITAKSTVMAEKSFTSFVRGNIARLPLKLLASAGMRMSATKAASGASESILAADKAALEAETAAAKAAAKSGRAAAAAESATAASAAAKGATMGAKAFTAAELGFTAASIALDMTNTGNLAEVNLTQDYANLKKTYDKNREDTYKANNLQPVQFASPVDALSKDALDLGIATQIFNIISEPSPAEASVVAKVIQSMMARWAAKGYGTMTHADIEFSMGDNTVISDDDYKALTRLAVDRLCVSEGGVLFKPGNSNYPEKMCTYSDAKKCTSAYAWPAPDDTSDYQYYEWRKPQYFIDNGFTYGTGFPSAGACIHAGPGFRQQCEVEQKTAFGTSHDIFDINEGMCYNSPDTCRIKSISYDGGGPDKYPTCYVSAGQEIAETVFGSTVVRGLGGSFAPGGPASSACSIM